MTTAAQNMEFERAGRVSGSDPGHRDPADQTAGNGQDLQNRDVFGYYVDKGWMCVQVFFVRQGQADRA